MADSLVIIPTYNEKENIAAIIEAVFSLDIPLHQSFHILIIDDNSPDGTAEIIEQLIKKHPFALHLIKRNEKQGLGSAYLRGFVWALDKGYNYICEMDADFSHNPADLLRLRTACDNQAPVVVGSRYVKGGKCKNWPLNRKILSYGASFYVRLITGMRVKDPTAGFVCYNRAVLEMLDLEKIRFKGYAFQIEMKYAAMSMGYEIIEVPITFIDRIIGHSKMSKNIIQEAVFGVLNMHLSKFTPNYYNKKNQVKLRIDYSVARQF